jgi:hypothetical protein
VRGGAPVTSSDTDAGAVTSTQGQVEASIPGGGGFGRIVPIRDSARASELARRRWDKAAAAARRGMAKAGAQLPDVSRAAPLAVLEYLVEQHTLNAADPSARGSQSSLKQVVELAFPKPEREAAGPALPEGGAVLALTAEQVDTLLAELRQARERRAQVTQVFDAE